ncbi:MAG: hypothetical protein FJY80_15385 [Candidatus Aminicenantes bacterium]|nr:hypothetical protein [Candidatus Aminicenantes bacterium]MBM3312881.1 hypothetical protein [Candidatus Aminicenantes bacterium]
MKIKPVLLILLGIIFVAPQAFGQVGLFERPVEYAVTADVLWLMDKDYGFELASTLSARSSWSVRFGYTKHREGVGGPGDLYHDGKGRWYLGFRWRWYYPARAPHLLFVSAGWDNRPQDNLVTPLIDAGLSLNFKPLTVSVLYSVGYEIYVRSRTSWSSRWVHGPEIRAGFCF